MCKFEMNISDYISLSSAVIALSAMGIAIWQGYVSRRHNILSVAPKLGIHTSYLNGLTLTLENNGLGPAVIESFTLTCGNKEYINPTNDIYSEALSSIGLDPMELEFSYEYHLPTKDTTYTAGTRKRLLEIIPRSEKCTLETLNKIDNSLLFKIKYRSMYENEKYSI